MKYEIDIEGLPEGWKAVAYRVPKVNIEFVFIENVVREAKPQDKKCLIVEKIKPRRLVFEETLKSNNTGNCQVFLSNNENGILTRVSIASDLLWREVKETDIPLTKGEAKLSLSVDDSIKWAEILILQLDKNHQGRNSWLCHYGRSKQAEEARKTSIFEYIECDGRFNISIRKDK